LRTHPGVGALTALAFVLIIGRTERFSAGSRSRVLGLVPLRLKRKSATTGHIPKQGSSMLRFLLVKRPKLQHAASRNGAVSTSTWRCVEDGRSPRWRWRGDWLSLSIGCGARDELRAVKKVRFARGQARNRRWCAVEHREIDWAAAPLRRGVRSSNHDRGCDRRDAWVGPRF